MFTGRILLLHEHKLSQVSAICILWIIVCDGKMGFECEICHDRILEGCIPCGIEENGAPEMKSHTEF